MTIRERAEQIAAEQLAKWPTETLGILRTAIRDDLMIPAIMRAIRQEGADCEHELCGPKVEGKQDCLDCGETFVLCIPCTKSDGAGIDIYHAEPVCP